MQQITFYRHGASVATAAENQAGGGKRGVTSGWSKGAARRNVQFLRSIDEARLDGVHVCATLTVRDCPPNAAVWSALRRRWEHRLRRAGMLRMHWVTELQRRGVPHLHALIGFPADWEASAVQQTVVSAWLAVAAVYGAGPQSQDVREWDVGVAWLAYLGKHVGRRGGHYQRAALPAGWEKSGGVWGHPGDWPVQEPERALTGDREGYRMRRVMKRYQVAEARRREQWQGVRYARRMLKAPERKLAEVRGVSVWIPEAISRRMAEWAHEVDGREASPSRPS